MAKKDFRLCFNQQTKNRYTTQMLEVRNLSYENERDRIGKVAREYAVVEVRDSL